MKKWTIVVAIGACLAVCTPTFAGKHFWPGVCSAFNAKGDSAAATITPGWVLLNITYSTGRIFRLSAGVTGVTPHEMQTGDVGCNAFFSSDGTYLAIAFNKGELQGGTYQGLYTAKAFGIVVANLKTKKIVGNFPIKPEGPLRAPLLVAGFLLAQPNIVVLGEGPGKWPKVSYSEVVLSVDGKQVRGPKVPVIPKGWLPTFNTLDAKHNRLWLYNSSSECDMRPISLLGRALVGHTVDEPKDVCQMGYLAFPDADMLIGAEGEPDLHVASFDMANGKSARVNLPHARGNLTSVNGALLSPDGKVFAAVSKVDVDHVFWRSARAGLPPGFLPGLAAGADRKASAGVFHRPGKYFH